AVVGADHGDDGVAGLERDALDAGGGAAHGAGVVLVEADGDAAAGDEHDVVGAAGEADVDQPVALVEAQGDDAGAGDVLVELEAGALDQALLGGKDEEVAVLLEVLDGQEGADL